MGKCKSPRMRGFAQGDKIQEAAPTIADAVRLMTPQPIGSIPAFDPMADMRNLGKVNPVGSGLGAGANYGWSTLSATDVANASGVDPNAAYKVGAVPVKAVAAPAALPEPKKPMPVLTSVDQLFPTRRFANGDKIQPLVEQPTLLDMIRQRATDFLGNFGGPTTTVVRHPAVPAPIDNSPDMRGFVPLAIDAIRERQRLINEAANYAGGGKIKGKGTATSDSIPAVVADTGEQIQVSNGERVLSVAQDGMMERVAKHLGFDGLDAMLEHGTGKPVGATMKDGKPAAASGLTPEEIQAAKDRAALLAGMVKPLSAAADVLTLPVRGVMGAVNTALRVPNAFGADIPYIPEEAFGGSSSSLTPYYDRYGRSAGLEPMGPPASAAQPVRAPAVPVVIPADAVGRWGGEGNQPMGSGVQRPDFVPDPAQPLLKSGQWRVGTPSGSVAGTASRDASRMFAPSGGGFVTAPGGGRAIMIPGGGTPYVGADGKPTAHWTDTPEYAAAIARNKSDSALALQMERDRYGRDMQSDITNPVVVALAGANLNRMNANATAEQLAATAGQQATTAGLVQETERQKIAHAARLEQLLGSLNDPNLTPEQKSSVRATLLAAQGKDINEHRYLTPETKEFGELGMPISSQQRVFDTVTQKYIGGAAPSAAMSAVPREGSRSTSNGQPIIFRGGKWERI